MPEIKKSFDYKKEIEIVKPEIKVKIKAILKEVEDLSFKYKNLESFGIATMKQSAEILEFGKIASPFVIEALYLSKNFNYKYWLVDILGYLKDKRNILPLLSIVEDENEEIEIRKRAVESVAEIGGKEAIKFLKDSYKIVKNEEVKEKIAEVIVKLEERF
ncbi:MAG: hypothetical protein DRI36_04500 [Caldiserica bacterium]|nr:MAG: hypothetical protein DRI36_04500 [Caldisericota bacterium]